MLLSVFFLVWMYSRHQKSKTVQAKQPIFLGMLIIFGTFILMLAVIPLSLQEPVSQHGLDIACASILWLISIGFVTAFSALFTKLWCLNQLFHVS
jgi:hypothetical protein